MGKVRYNAILMKMKKNLKNTQKHQIQYFSLNLRHPLNLWHMKLRISSRPFSREGEDLPSQFSSCSPHISFDFPSRGNDPTACYRGWSGASPSPHFPFLPHYLCFQKMCKEWHLCSSLTEQCLQCRKE